MYDTKLELACSPSIPSSPFEYNYLDYTIRKTKPHHQLTNGSTSQRITRSKLGIYYHLNKK